jgi:hypothetical protein
MMQLAWSCSSGSHGAGGNSIRRSIRTVVPPPAHRSMLLQTRIAMLLKPWRGSVLLLTPLSTRSRLAPRRLEGLGNGGLRAELRVLAHHHHLRHQRQRPQCRARHARPPVRRQHQRLHVCWPSLYVCQHLRSLRHGMAFGPTELDNKEFPDRADENRWQQSIHSRGRTVPLLMRSATLVI